MVWVSVLVLVLVWVLVLVLVLVWVWGWVLVWVWVSVLEPCAMTAQEVTIYIPPIYWLTLGLVIVGAILVGDLMLRICEGVFDK